MTDARLRAGSHGPSVTAVAVAAGRAIECTRPDRLVCDPYAVKLVSAARVPIEFPAAWPASPTDVPPAQWPLLLSSSYVGLRTRFIDDFLMSRDRPAQTVSLGAGLDARAYRLPWPSGAHLFELDDADLLEFKRAVIEADGVLPRCQMTLVGADISQEWGAALRTSGFDPASPAMWVIEGLLPYLSAEAQTNTLTLLAELSSSGSCCVLERTAPLPQTPDLEAKLEELSALIGLPMATLLARTNVPDPVEVLGGYGWTTEVHTLHQLGVRYGRRLERPGVDALKSEDEPSSAGDSASRGGFVIARLP